MRGTRRFAAAMIGCAVRGCRSRGAGLSQPLHHRGGAVPGRRAERRGGAHRRRADGPDARPDAGDRERRRRRRHASAAAGSRRRRRTATRCSPARMGSHVAAPVLTPNIKYDSARDFIPIGPTAHSPAVIVARKDFPAKDLKEFVALLKARRRDLEAGPRRHRLVVAHGVPAVHHRDRRQAHARRLSRHRAGDERPGRRPCRFLLRAVGQRRPSR